MLSHPISVSTVDCILDWQNPRETDLFFYLKTVGEALTLTVKFIERKNMYKGKRNRECTKGPSPKRLHSV
jgi:hypothetical protein